MPDPIGEDRWLDLTEEAKRTADDIEKYVEVLELFKRAVAVEPCSIKIWLAYCEWVWSLYKHSQADEMEWPEEERSFSREIFNLQTALDIWQQGAQATEYRLNDSHLLWNKWISIELEILSESVTDERIERVRKLFIQRLQIPHMTWDDTSQMLSTFLTKYSEVTWESTMVEVTKIAKEAKDLYRQREMYESKLQTAVESGSSETVESLMLEYISWEQGQAYKKIKKEVSSKAVILCIALYERALTSTGLTSNSSVWEDYIVFLVSIRSGCYSIETSSILSICHRGTTHCPWSGKLWTKYILCAETELLPFSKIEQIKHTAITKGQLDRDGMNDVILLYVAWCGYLKRQTMAEEMTNEKIDSAEIGISTALKDVNNWGVRRDGNAWKGDPYFRIEMMLIQSLSQKDAFEQARDHWRKFTANHLDSYDFWYQYYQWEMEVRDAREPPKLATAVLTQAIRQKNLDWPEKMIEIYVNHCNNHEKAHNMLQAACDVHRICKGIAKRREREANAYNSHSDQLSSEVKDPMAPSESELYSEKSQRKRKFEEHDGTSSKKIKILDQVATQDQNVKRDRENNTIVVTNLAMDVTETKVKNYFKGYAHINSITLKKNLDTQSSIALIELKMREDVQSALLKDNKYFGDRQISVTPGTGLTLYVTNYPPTADDAYFHELFKSCGEILSIRWPSIRYKTSRRFIYITFRTPQGAENAIKLNNLSLGGVYKLFVAYSNPNIKKDREGATAEGREIHVTNLDTRVTEEDVKEIFSKYGTVQKVNILRKISGESKGAAFIVFTSKEEASSALQLDKTKLKSSLLSVEISKERNFKHTATVNNKTSMEVEKDDHSLKSPRTKIGNDEFHSVQLKAPSKSEIADRTITLLNIPDIINDSRIHSLASSYGDIVRLILRPDHQATIIEFSNAASAGKAMLGLDNYEIVPGHRIRLGTSKDLFVEKDKVLTQKTQLNQKKEPTARLMQPIAPIRRPNIIKGNQNDKKSLPKYLKSSTTTKDSISPETNGPGIGDDKKQMTNADFKALYSSKKIPATSQ